MNKNNSFWEYSQNYPICPKYPLLHLNNSPPWLRAIFRTRFFSNFKIVRYNPIFRKAP